MWLGKTAVPSETLTPFFVHSWTLSQAEKQPSEAPIMLFQYGPAARRSRFATLILACVGTAILYEHAGPCLR